MDISNMAQTNRYPVARSPAPRDVQPRVRPVPANDNLPRRAPIPANDNWRMPSRPLAPRSIDPVRLAPRILPRVLGRLLPILGWALLAYDLWELWRWLQAQEQSNHDASGVCVPEGGFINPTYPTNRWKWDNNTSCGPNPGPGAGYTVGAPPAQPPMRNVLKLAHLAFMSTGEVQDHRWWVYPEPWNGVDPSLPVEENEPVVIPAFQPDPWYIPWVDPFVPPFMPQPLPEPGPVRNRPPLVVRPEASSRGSHDPTARPTEDPQPLPGRPPKGVKERKIQGRKGSAFRKYGGALLSHASEAGDLLDVLHDALPDEYQAKDGTMKDKLLAVYQHQDKVDMEKAVRGIIENHQEDRIWGKGFAKVSELFDSYGIDLGSLRL